MNNMASKILFFISIFYVTWQCYSLENENFKMIYAVDDQIFIKDSGKNKNSKKLLRVLNNITSLAVHDGYLYLSAISHNSTPSFKESAIYRFKVTNSTRNFEIDNKSRVKLQVTKNGTEVVTCMAIANGAIFAGRNDGVIWRCLIGKPYSCTNFDKLNGSIVKIDYNPEDGKIYAHEGLYENPNSVKIKFTRSCLPDIPNSCKLVISYDTEITAVKVAFDALWFGTETGNVWKCPLNIIDESSTSTDENCFRFVSFNPAYPIEISASHKYLYVNIRSLLISLFPGNYIWRCDPDVIDSCSTAHRRIESNHMDSVIIL